MGARVARRVELSRGERNIVWIEEMCRVPEGRLVGQAMRLRQWQKDIIVGIYDTPTRRAIISFGRKNGKGLALDTPIPTPNGWRTMADIEAGDFVYGSDGHPTRVTDISEVHTGLRCWRLTFSDGSQIVADEQHRWLTTHSYRPWAAARRNGSGNGGRWVTEIVTTPQIAESVNRTRRDGGIERNHKIAAAPALMSAAANLSIDPYVLGAWLGDGSSAQAKFWCGDEDLEHLAGQIEAAGYPVKRRRERTAWALAATGARGAGGSLQSKFRALGVLNDKHIPAAYFDASTEQRWALLQGLMDTDGTSSSSSKTPQCQFVSTNCRLAYDVWRLLRSLGIKACIREGRATLKGRDVGADYSITFNASIDQPIFRLPRKQDRLPPTLAGRCRTLAIVACEEVPSVPTKCIAVEASDRLYLAGHGCVPTHNTALAACLLLLHLCGPEAKANSQLYSAAQSRDQAAILFGLAAKMVRMSPELSTYVVPVDSGKRLNCPELGTVYRALSADASTAYGLSPVFIVHDELGQVKGPRSELYEAMETATAAQVDPLSIVISTQAPADADLLSVLIDDAKTEADPRVRLFLYTAPVEMETFGEEAIRAANPAFGDFQNATEVLAMAEDARRQPSRQPEFENLVLNRRVEMFAPFVSRPLWLANAGAGPVEFDDLPVFGGLDLSETADLTALVLTAPFEGKWHVRPTFWLPADGLRDKALKDRVPYDLWHKQGFLQAAPGRSVDYEFVADHLRGVCDRYDVRKIAFDRWNFRHLRPWLLKAGFEETDIEGRFVEFGQGFQSMSPALRDLETKLLNERLVHGDHPVLTMCAANAVVQPDPAGNRKLSKAKSRGRIDGMVALVMAMSVAETAEETAEPSYQMLFV